jgi:hypothetical protein
MLTVRSASVTIAFECNARTDLAGNHR